MGYTTDLDWTSPNPHDVRYWDLLVKAMQSRRIKIDPIYENNRIYVATGIAFDYSTLVPRITSALRDDLASYLGNWRNSDGTAMTWRDVCGVGNLSETYGAGSPLSNCSEFLKRIYLVLKSYRYQPAKFRLHGHWSTGNTSRYTSGTTLAEAMAYLDTNGSITYNSDIYESSSFSAQMRAQWYGGAHFNIYGYYAYNKVTAIPKLPVSCSLKLTSSGGSGALSYPDIYDGFSTGFAEGDTSIAITQLNQEILPAALTYRVPANAGITDPTMNYYGFSASGLYDYGDTFILTPFED